MNTKTATLVLAVLLALLAAPAAAAQEAPTTSTTPTTTAVADGSSSNATDVDAAKRAPTVAGDDDLHIVDFWKDDGVMYVELYAERSAFVTVSARGDSSAEMSTGYVSQNRMEPRSFATVAVTAPGGTASVSSSDSYRNGKFTVLDVSSGSLLSGPFAGSDVRDAAIGGALGVGVPVLYSAVRAKTGAAESVERVA